MTRLSEYNLRGFGSDISTPRTLPFLSDRFFISLNIRPFGNGPAITKDDDENHDLRIAPYESRDRCFAINTEQKCDEINKNHELRIGRDNTSCHEF